MLTLRDIATIAAYAGPWTLAAYLGSALVGMALQAVRDLVVR
jgi:hypothetical protein